MLSAECWVLSAEFETLNFEPYCPSPRILESVSGLTALCARDTMTP